MTDWLGMSVPPRTPRPELKGRVLVRALARRRRWPLAVAAALVLIAAGAGGAWWAHRTIAALVAERDRLAARVAALDDTVASFIHDPATRPAAVMAMDRDQPMVMALPLPQAGEQVRGAAMTIEPRAGSASPSGPTVFRVDL